MNSLNTLFANKFRGCKQIGHTVDTDRDLHLRVFELPPALFNEGDAQLVGIDDGSSCWAANPAHCLFGMKPGASALYPVTRARRVIL